MLDKLQKRICRTVGSSRAASLKAFLAHHRNQASLLLKFVSVDITLIDVHLNYFLPYSRGRSTSYSDRLLDFTVDIPGCYRDLIQFNSLHS